MAFAYLGATRLRVAVRTLLGPALSKKIRAAQRRVLGNPRPKLFFNLDDVSDLAAKDVARALSLAVLYSYGADVEGDVAEFGTMSGSTAQALAIAIVAAEARSPWMTKKQLHLFDSFEGLPEISSEVDAQSPHVLAGVWAPKGCKVLSMPELRRVVERLLPSSRVTIHKGWFADTIKALPDSTRFSVIHFDGDLYSSMIDALVPCFERRFITEGAIICFDDWNCNKSSDAFGERRAWIELVEKYNIKFSHAGNYGWACTKMIVHSYDRVR
jgi:O-methyltransferase